MTTNPLHFPEGNPFLEDNLRPVANEITDVHLKATGTIPAYLDGRYLRNGPNPVAEVDPETYAWFAGDGMVHGVRLRDGQAHWYRNRYVRSTTVAHALGERTPRNRFRDGFRAIGANTNVIGHAGKTLALVEGGVASFEMTDELDTVGTCSFDGTLHGGYTAHPLRDPESGELHAISYSFGRGNTVQYSVIGRDGRARRNIDIEVNGSPMMHGFALTSNYVLVFDFPVTFDQAAAASLSMPRRLRKPAELVLNALIGRVHLPDPITIAIGNLAPGNKGFPYSWDNDYPARIGVLPREAPATAIRWFDIEPCYIFHQANAYEDGDTIVLDGVRHRRVFDQNRRDPIEGDPAMHRWVLNLLTGTVHESQIDDRLQEFPRVDERVVGRPHRYAYAPMLSEESEGPTGVILKHDLHTGNTIARDLGPGKEAAEFVFEPASADAAEDDGVLMGYVYDRADDRTDLTFLDAGTLETVGQVHLPQRVPHGFHGNWVPTGL
ncbi:carotenoid oxygenase family protein [Nocardia sp. NPDC127606]|uniref:carotenoid oxygenase family protein n=1 Tax=Nocardia sp. NPDC127606 TaxID=3345406 RepID=UPI00363046B7